MGLGICRGKKTVVVAIRGTVSLADLVTDAVVHPEPLHNWLSAATRKVNPPPLRHPCCPGLHTPDSLSASLCGSFAVGSKECLNMPRGGR